MINRFWLFLLILPILVVSCRTVKPVFIEKVTTDSILIKDTIYSIVLESSEQFNTTNDTISLIESKYAKTEAKVSNGVLEHNLITRDKEIEVRVEYRDRIITNKVPVPYEVEKIVKVEKKLSFIQRTKMRLGEFAFIVLSGGILAFLFKIFIKRI